MFDIFFFTFKDIFPLVKATRARGLLDLRASLSTTPWMAKNGFRTVMKREK